AADDDGSRGIALLLRHPAALEDQLAAILAEGADCRLRILLPMVDDVSQLVAVEEVLAHARARTRVTGGSLGAMIETPAAVAGAPRVGPLRAQIRSLSLEACRAAAHSALDAAPSPR